nr:NAD(P)-binding domain-containing protein [Corynebacterium lactis]
MTTAVIGVGNIGKGVITGLARGGEKLLIANRTDSKAEALAAELGEGVTAVSIDEAVERADTIILAIWFADQQKFITERGAELAGKLIIDPSNPIGFDDKGQVFRTVDDGVSSGQLNRDSLADGVKFAKAFGTLSADSLASGANKDPKVALFYASDENTAGQGAGNAGAKGEIDSEVERLISVAGFTPVKAGSIDEASLRIEVLGDLHPFGGLNGVDPTEDTAKELLAK